MFDIIANIYYFIISIKNYLLGLIYSKPIDFKSIPIIINNRNRYTFLVELIFQLKKRGYNNIIILDNDSKYPPLLKFYKETECEVIFLNKNIGYDALDKIPLYKKIRKNFFVYTDPDVIPVDECPEDFMLYFLETLKKFPFVQKVGFSLKIDDLPDHYNKKDEVINWEKKFYNTEILSNLYSAPIDTTFALHRPFARISFKGRFKMIRTGFPYEARHMTWYNNSKRLGSEEIFYQNNVEIGTHWSKGIEVTTGNLMTRLIERFKL